ncbi:phosphoribosylanthranilate isomerase [Sphingobacterium cellulitidis]|uniref:phosphoribosylanthranilate isomerase n=1 Tax=Sphingobacterium cellulitidis TaxID=1768011 RepID=UPI003C7BFA9F
MPKELLIKVCGMKEPDNISQLLELPIHYIGHIFYQKSARYVGDLANLDISKNIKKTGVFVNSSIAEILESVNRLSLKAVQLHGDETAEMASALKSEGLEVIKAFGIDEEFDWKQLESFVDHVDFFLFDSKSPAYGGTGKAFNWQKLKEYPFEKPYFLSGGLSLDNLEEAINFEDKRLVGLDLNSKFEIEPGLKDIEKLKLALKTIRNEQISSK